MKLLTETLKKEKGIAAMDIFVSVIVSLFLLGIILGLFAITNAEFIGTTDDATAISVINDTTIALSSAVDWFPIIVVIAAVVVVLGLLVYVIVSVKRSGMTGGA